MLKRSRLIIFFIILIIIVMFDLRITFQISYYINNNLNAILTEYNKGLYDFLKSNDEDDILSSIRIAEQFEISNQEILINLSLTNLLFRKQNKKYIDYIRNLLNYSRQLYVSPKNNNTLNEIYSINEQIINLSSDVKTKGILKTLSMQKQIITLVDKANFIMADSIRN
ncbi:hypothetical protein ABG79_01395 [Caloramator mitchellensis]|uniref:Uncharacterized protein n=1 Tax=Caloramator mitchellensis TaxID=908809 RepID=A0A0R3JTT9_CALMK|nr:hypothetical protein [Caloramator mitchellensis]KRQ86904.1 hypothetical protein ABG79_01395 [Caloramator mitchellensis]